MPLVHKIGELYKNIYFLSGKIPKRDKFGIYSKVENICLEIFCLSISASFSAKSKKTEILSDARVRIELLKRLIRIMQELNLIEQRKYLELELDLQEISKMANGWIKYLQENPV